MTASRKHRQWRARCPHGKVKYATADAATQDAVRLVSTSSARKAGVYVCPDCDHFHVTRALKDCFRVVEAETRTEGSGGPDVG